MDLINVESVGVTYGEGEVPTHALRDVTLTIPKGEFAAIMGPSGSGKSTLLHILGFLDRPTKGVYRFEGRTIDEYSDDELAHVRNKKMGFVFQSFNLLPRTSVYENVKLPLTYSDVPERRWHEMVKSAIRTVGLEHRREHETSELSGGERQRVAIARALVNRPDVIFADEPTGNLDSKSGQTIMETIQELNEQLGHTIVLITHEKYAAEYAERIIYIKDGTVEGEERVQTRHKKGDHYAK